MSEDLVKYESGIKELIEQQKAEIKKFLAPTLTEGEFWMFIQTAKVLDLNPLKREIYPVKYQDKFQIITGYEVYLKRANRSKLLEWWKVEIQKPFADFKTWVGVFTAKRRDWTLEFRWEVPMVECFKSSEKATPWTTMKEFMLKKTSIAQGLRLLIPEVLAGMPYIAEEMGSQVIENEYTVNPDEQKIEPAPLEQEDKDKVKNDFLDKLMNQLMEIKTIADLEKKYKTSKKSYESSEMKDSILSLFASRKKQLTIEEIANKTGLAVYMVQTYIDESKSVSDGLISEILADNKDAILQFVEQATLFPVKNSASKTKEQSDSEEMMQEEMDLQEI